MEFRIGIVDDSEAFLKLSEGLLRHSYEKQLGNQVPLKVETFTRGKDFLVAVKDRPFDLVLLDYSMPTMDGIQTMKLIRSYNPTIQMIFVVSKLNEEILDETRYSDILLAIEKDQEFVPAIMNFAKLILRLKILQNEKQKVQLDVSILKVVSIILTALSIGLIIWLFFT
jgi:CheY-like chemotaxis protein